MTQEHPITPPPELVQQWINEEEGVFAEHIATQAARWGANQELEACLDEIYKSVGLRLIPYGSHRELLCSDLRAARRPRTLSLKEQALKELKNWTDEKHGPGGEVFLCEGLSVAIIREALESLPS